MTNAEIIAALQNAKGPDRELDGWIAQACGGARNPKAADKGFGRMPGDNDEGYYRLPCFTASLDAAVALVERERPGWVWEIYSDCSARIWEDVVRRYPPDFTATAANPAIALCIALMKSMEDKG